MSNFNLICITTHSLSLQAESSLPDLEKNMQAAAEHALCEKYMGRGTISCVPMQCL
jgi:hypothetical protein